MANNDRYRGSGYPNYGNREEDRERYNRKNYDQYESDYGNSDDYGQRRDYSNTNSGSYNDLNNSNRNRRYDEDNNDYYKRTKNRSQDNYGNDYGSSSQYNRDNYNNTSGYGAYGYGNEYNRSRGQDYNQDYGTSSYGYGNNYNRNRDNNDYNNQNDRGWWDKTKDEVASWMGDEDAEKRRRQDRRMGAHRGRGPKGYTRSDERIREDVNDRLSDDSYLDATEIDVTVSNGEVTLIGTVENRIDKRRAEDLAEDISGVKNVQNQLRVKQTTTTSVNGLKNEYQG
jgi:osmotically-inducible protein OsmY